MESKPLRSTMYYSNEIKKLKQNSKKYHELIKQFLQNFKVYPCTQQSKHNPQTCFYYHDDTDRRRNPYFNHQFRYNIFQMCNCNSVECLRVHNKFESAYHPLAYKVNQCQKQSNCQFGFICCYLHPQDIMHFQYGQFFRFDLRTFKTEKCYKKNVHQRKTCLYFHNDKDKRRPCHIQYSHVYCEKKICNNQYCEYSHNKLQQLYHINRYKTKFCQFYGGNIEKCEYKSFCSFAHTQNQIEGNLQLLHLIPDRNTDFHLYKYKTVWCPFTQNHERDKCVYAHNIQDYRRNPKVHEYHPIRCDAWNFEAQIKSIEQSGCSAGMLCKKCHGWMELRYHPSKYPPKRTSKSLKKEQMQFAETYVQKKIPSFNLASDYKPKGKGNTNPQILKNNFTKGTPFFKNDKYSQHSQKTKARSNNIQSDKSIDGSENREQLKSTQLKIQLKPIGGIFSFAEGEDDINWQQSGNDPKFIQQMHKKQQNSSRSKSARKSDQYQVTYSNSIKNAFQDDQILKKLRKERFNQIQIVNMDQTKIDKLSFLSPQQKARLSKKLHIYNLRQTYSVIYSKQLTRYFISKKKQSILQKMQQKKVKQAKLLKLVPKQINQLSFLESQQKNILPKLLKQYNNEKEFKQLNQRIEQQTKMK